MSEKVFFTAGQFEVETWTKSWPMWVTINYRGKEAIHHMHHGDLKDLMFVLDRIRNRIRAEIGEQYQHELE